MAIKHIRLLARELAERYEKAQLLYLKFAENTANICMSQEDVAAFDVVRSAVSNNLNLLSVAFSASVTPQRFATIREQVDAPVRSFSRALTLLLDDATKDGAPMETQTLIGTYSTELRKARETQIVLEQVEFYKDLPNRKEKSNLFLRSFLFQRGLYEPDILVAGFDTLCNLSLPVTGIFNQVDAAMLNLERYIDSATEIIANAAGDLEE